MCLPPPPTRSAKPYRVKNKVNINPAQKIINKYSSNIIKSCAPKGEVHQKNKIFKCFNLNDHNCSGQVGKEKSSLSQSQRLYKLKLIQKQHSCVEFLDKQTEAETQPKLTDEGNHDEEPVCQKPD